MQVGFRYESSRGRSVGSWDHQRHPERERDHRASTYILVSGEFLRFSFVRRCIPDENGFVLTQTHPCQQQPPTARLRACRDHHAHVRWVWWREAGRVEGGGGAERRAHPREQSPDGPTEPTGRDALTGVKSGQSLIPRFLFRRNKDQS